ncbi:hypothetical protein [Urechidicola sp. KH5]
MLQLPFIYLVGITLDYRPLGVYSAITLAEIVIAIVSLIWFSKGNWKSVKVLGTCASADCFMV